ncbi:disintegrin and metalloproteinase domain-containing protein 20-like [Rhineura floridana]|uniref:disintegrin and metalloproteinase domain-containing protein 20-like n=1 Tax=Rhineura floridana TaxID=261503 RepID=UPI002AC80915|nr:disintegrin and metalloproteinase domain-containing protein 20-like [Rhineura floridana]
MNGSLAWLLMMFLRNLMSETSGQSPPQGFRYASYEVTIPRKLSFRYGLEEAQDVSYLLQIEGKGQVVQLRQKTGLVPKHFPVFTYNKQGDLQVDYPFIRDDCFYSGFVQGKPHSLVTLSTCSGGLRGLLQLKNETYEIEPVQASATFQHVVYRLDVEEGAIRQKCGLTEEEQSHQEAMIQNTEHAGIKSAPAGRWWPHTRYAKVAIVVEHERYVKFNRNESDIAVKVLEMFHTVNSYFEPLSIQVSLAGLEIWSERNPIEISNDIGDVLWDFNKWRQNNLLKHLKNDAAHLLVYKGFRGIIGIAYLSQICSDSFGSAVDSLRTFRLYHFSELFAHELGHNLGMNHDGLYCKCDRQACIMSVSALLTDKFSNCSYQDYFRLRNRPCLFVPPDPDKMYQLKKCGNKVVENGEQCDCGSVTECHLDPCCKSNCMLHPCANCALGPCCDKCRYRPAGSLCRKKISVCDLPEYCNGTSEWCPEDTYVQDGAPCSDGAYCYHGHCTTHNRQCKMIFGKKATVASENCFRVLNIKGDRFGNCGLRHGTFKKCSAENVLCGRIQCDNINKLSSLEEHSTIIQSTIGDTQCWSTDYHSGMGTADIGAVRDGTPCGSDMMCVHGECQRVSLLKYDCNVTKCHHRGICNSYKHCHCDYGWAPPDCLKKGYGGSIDSGQPKERSDIIGGSILGSVFILAAAAVGVGLGVYYRIMRDNT